MPSHGAQPWTTLKAAYRDACIADLHGVLQGRNKQLASPQNFMIPPLHQRSP